MPKIKQTFGPHREGFQQVVKLVVDGLGRESTTETGKRVAAAEQLAKAFGVERATLARSLHKYMVDKQSPTIDVVRKLIAAAELHKVLTDENWTPQIAALVEYCQSERTRERAAKLRPFVRALIKECYVKEECSRMSAIASVTRGFAEALRQIEVEVKVESCEDLWSLAMKIEKAADDWEEREYVSWLEANKAELEQSFEAERAAIEREIAMTLAEGDETRPTNVELRRYRIFGIPSTSKKVGSR